MFIKYFLTSFLKSTFESLTAPNSAPCHMKKIRKALKRNKISWRIINNDQRARNVDDDVSAIYPLQTNIEVWHQVPRDPVRRDGVSFKEAADMLEEYSKKYVICNRHSFSEIQYLIQLFRDAPADIGVVKFRDSSRFLNVFTIKISELNDDSVHLVLNIVNGCKSLIESCHIPLCDEHFNLIKKASDRVIKVRNPYYGKFKFMICQDKFPEHNQADCMDKIRNILINHTPDDDWGIFNKFMDMCPHPVNEQHGIPACFIKNEDLIYLIKVINPEIFDYCTIYEAVSICG